METATCKHNEKLGSGVQGVEIGECIICHQRRRYDKRGARTIVEIIKLGRLDGKLVLPGPKEKIAVSDEEAAELEAARKAQAPVLVHTEEIPGDTAEQKAEQPPLYIGKPQKYRRGVRKWGKRCIECEFSYLHDEQIWCASRRCPQRCPVNLRPQYRPKEEAKAGFFQEQSEPNGREWYQAHKKEMIEDLITMDLRAFLEKWKVKKQIVSHLKSDKLYKTMAARSETSKVPIAGKAAGRGELLPPFPAWAPEKWVSSEIAVQWLKTYEVLAIKAFLEQSQRKRGFLSRLFKR